MLVAGWGHLHPPPHRADGEDHGCREENALAEHAAQQGDGRNAEDPYTRLTNEASKSHLFFGGPQTLKIHSNPARLKQAPFFDTFVIFALWESLGFVCFICEPTVHT